MKTTHIYILKHPETGHPFYVGKTTRLEDTRKMLTGKRQPKNLAMLKCKEILQETERSPIFEVVEEVASSLAGFKVLEYVDSLTSQGFQLYNVNYYERSKTND